MEYEDYDIDPCDYIEKHDGHIDDWCLIIADATFRQYMAKHRKDENANNPNHIPF
jgi:hypothetical protein